MNHAKQNLREKCKALRADFDTADCSLKICECIRDWSIYQKANNIMLFYPLISEYSLLQLLEDKNKSFYFPCVNGDCMYPVLYNEHKGFKRGKFNINEPVGERLLDLSLLDLIFIPALAVDKSGCRLGYGKGYYDRFLCNVSDSVKVVPICSELVFDKIPSEPHDVCADCIVTENSIVRVTY